MKIRGRVALLVDDIIDTGHTLAFAKAYLTRLQPAALKTCVLLDKPARRQVGCKPDYHGFRIENEYVVGYGLDWAGRFRALPYIAALSDSCITAHFAGYTH